MFELNLYASLHSINHEWYIHILSHYNVSYHDSNGWILSKGYWSASCDFWDWSNFDKSGKNLKTQQEIEIPSFREKKYTPLYKIEGTEDLSDHVFEKRHLQYEIMEKKIKKNFVMQSKYELQKSKYLKNNELLYKKESFFVKKFPKFIELNPEVTDVKKIEIVTEVPVMAFGVPVKKMETLEFNNLIQGVTE
ncbi:protein male-specific lethal-1-like [Diaphorina citri]|uniref:Protein male-specific lethal-1-like n=1 Tax=Diaphorina citri TaxID=121845 RepID=A0A3Q0JB53_DIACI|nr:protein male-specific lethal-1-like [Diaphorina citri]